VPASPASPALLAVLAGRALLSLLTGPARLALPAKLPRCLSTACCAAKLPGCQAAVLQGARDERRNCAGEEAQERQPRHQHAPWAGRLPHFFPTCMPHAWLAFRIACLPSMLHDRTRAGWPASWPPSRPGFLASAQGGQLTGVGPQITRQAMAHAGIRGAWSRPSAPARPVQSERERERQREEGEDKSETETERHRQRGRERERESRCRRTLIPHLFKGRGRAVLSGAMLYLALLLGLLSSFPVS